MPLHGTVTGSQILVDGDVINDYVTIIDNDNTTKAHGLKVTTDGTDTNTFVFDVESDDIHFRVRGDGRVGVGKKSGLPKARLTVDGTDIGASDSDGKADIAIAGKIMHIGDPNTHIMFGGGNTTAGNDSIELTAGGVSLFEGAVESEGASIFILSGSDGVGAGPDPGEFGDVALFVSGAIGSRGGGEGGTSVFGGDMCISGTLHIVTGSSASTTSNVVSMVAHGGRPVVGTQLTVINASAAQNTLPANGIVHSNGILRLGANEVTDVLPTAASIIALVPDPKFGLQIEFGFFNGGGNDVTIGGQSSIVNINQAQASFVITGGKGRMFRFAINSDLSSLTLLPVTDLFNLTS